MSAKHIRQKPARGTSRGMAILAMIPHGLEARGTSPHGLEARGTSRTICGGLEAAP